MDGDYRLTELCLQKIKAHPMKHTAIGCPEHQGTNFRARSQNVTVERQRLKRLHGGGLERESGAGWPKLRFALEDLALEARPNKGYCKSEATDTSAGDQYFAADLSVDLEICSRHWLLVSQVAAQKQVYICGPLDL
jgi:hypothetical protein